MSYASLLTLLAALAFALPFLARLGENIGIPRSYAVASTLALGIFFMTFAWLRWRLRDQAEVGRADTRPGVLPQETFVPDFFFHDGVFQGERLIEEGHQDAALKMYEAYRAVLVRQGHTTQEVDAMILKLERGTEETRTAETSIGENERASL